MTSVVAACATDSETPTTSEVESLGSVCDSHCHDECGGDCDHDDGCGGGEPEPPPGPSCVVRGETVFLDDAPANVNDNDRRVTYCHATSSAKNPYVLLTTSIRACKAHEEHEHLPKGGHLDVFGSDGCED